MTKLLLLRGLPGSGKSTKARHFIKDGSYVCHFEADMYHTTREGVYDFSPENIAASHEWCQSKTRKALAAGVDTIVSNTFTQQWELQPYRDMADELGVELIIKTVKGNYGNIHGCPQASVDAMAKRWED